MDLSEPFMQDCCLLANDPAEPEPISPRPPQQLQPEYYSRFHCLADACPDTCCEGWRVGVDKKTYEKYQQSADPELKPAFQKLVTINPAPASSDHYAFFTTSSGRCTFLSDGLCSIQKRLGESYLGAACASFPRVTNQWNGVLERSLDLSCPEAARLALLNPNPLEFSLVDPDPAPTEQVAQPIPGRARDHEHAETVRSFIRSLLQNRRYSVSRRLILLAHLCSKLQEITAQHEDQAVPAILDGFRFAIDAGLFDEHLNRCTADPATQLGIVLELITERIKSDFIHRRFLDLYQEFLDGLRSTPETTFAQVAENYAEAHRRFYLPLISRHEYVLEHYLVNNAFKTLFPFGSEGLNRALQLDKSQAFGAHYMLLTTYYAIAKAMLIGVAGRHGTYFNLDAVVRTIQICSKTFEHSFTYPRRILDILASNGVTTPAAMSVLTQN